MSTLPDPADKAGEVSGVGAPQQTPGSHEAVDPTLSAAVSVIMAVYNGEPFVGDAVKSVLRQTRRDFELIVIDDGSVDSTPETLAAVDDPRVRVITLQKNEGRAKAFDRGLQEVRTPLVGFVGADDLVEPQWLEILLRAFDEDPELDVVSCGLERVAEDGARSGEVVKGPLTHEEIAAAMLLGPAVSHGGMVGKSSAVARAGFSSPRAVAVDYYLWADLLLDGCRFGNVPDVLYLYRQHAAQGVRSRKPELRTAHREVQGRLVEGLWPQLSRTQQIDLADWLFWHLHERDPASVQSPRVMDRSLRVTSFLQENRPDSMSLETVTGWRRKAIHQELVAWGGRASVRPLMLSISEIPLRHLPKCIVRSLAASFRSNQRLRNA